MSHLRRLLALAFVAALLLQVACFHPIDLNGLPCGTNGECGSAHVCEGGFCLRNAEDPDAEQPNATFLVGAPCREDADCQGDGVSSAACLGTGNAAQSWPDGYCSVTCTKDTDCDKGPAKQGTSTCSEDSTGKSQCLKICTKSAGCRTGYKCEQLTDKDGSICVPS